MDFLILLFGLSLDDLAEAIPAPAIPSPARPTPPAKIWLFDSSLPSSSGLALFSSSKY
jgi:hypothetical protein